ncbi:unnamed protein product [Linum trigynum]|uniref:Uncharacterized protein n=1 Tax=Linum trigynum TaxID=586398 RepID=A0AAV2F8F7_9ROSI
MPVPMHEDHPMHVPMHEEQSPIELDHMASDEEPFDNVGAPDDTPHSHTSSRYEDSPSSTSHVQDTNDVHPLTEENVTSSSSHELDVPHVPRRNPP